MKLLYTLLFFLFLCSSCTSKKAEQAKTPIVEKNRPVPENSSTKIRVDTLLVKEKASDPPSGNQPNKALQNFVEEIEKMGWVSDPARLSKVASYRYLHEDQIEYFNDRPFYRINFEESALNHACTEGHYQRHLKKIDLTLFGNAKSIWAYFYRDKNTTDWIIDGVIEQWTFENEQQANLALKQMNDSGFTIYFNTNPYFCSIDNQLFIFQTRAMAFSYEQKPVFEKFNVFTGKDKE